MAGTADEDVKDALLVALSFTRAHGSWLHDRYKFHIDPRRRRRADWVLSFSSMSQHYTGGSLGAAAVGR
jgi:hypothetical protein